MPTKYVVVVFIRVVAGFYLFAVLCLCVWLLLLAFFDNFGAWSFDPNDIRTDEQWRKIMSSVAISSINLIVFEGFLLFASVIATVIAAWRRSALWFPICIIASVMLAGTLGLTANMARSDINSVNSKADNIMSQVKNPPQIPEQFPLPTFQEIEGEMRRVIVVTAESNERPLLDISGNPIAVEDVVLTEEVCSEPPSTGEFRQLTSRFSLRSDEDGAALRAAVDAWGEAGYVMKHAPKTAYEVFSETTLIRYANLNDRFTIDDTLDVQITSQCWAL